MVENEGGAPGATAASSNGPSGNLSIKILLNYKDTQETNSSSQPKKKINKNDERSHNKLFKRWRGFSFSLLPLF